MQLMSTNQRDFYCTFLLYNDESSPTLPSLANLILLHIHYFF